MRLTRLEDTEVVGRAVLSSPRRMTAMRRRMHKTVKVRFDRPGLPDEDSLGGRGGSSFSLEDPSWSRKGSWESSLVSPR